MTIQVVDMDETAIGGYRGPPFWPYSVHLAAGLALGTWATSFLPLAAKIAAVAIGFVVGASAVPALLCRRVRRPLIWLFLGLGLGALRTAALSEVFFRADHISQVLADWPMRVEMGARGRIVSGSRQSDSGWQAVVDLTEVRARGSRWEPSSGSLRIRWTQGTVLPVPSDVVELMGQATRAPPKAHPYDFDRRAHDARMGVAGTLVLQGEDVPRIIGRSRRPDLMLRGAIDRARLGMEAALADCTGPRVMSWILAAGSGTRAGFDPSDWDLMTRSGIAHVLAVSGMHLAIFVLTLRRVVQWLVSLMGWPLLYRHRQYYGAIVALPLSWIYTLFTGAGVATVRAALFVTFLALADVGRRRASSAGAIGASSAVILLVNPLDLFSASFQLSLTAVIGLAVAGSLMRNTRPPGRDGLWQRLMMRPVVWVRAAFAMSLAAWLGTAPVLAFHFGQISLSSLVSNILVAPILSTVLVAGSGAALALAPIWTDGARWIAVVCQESIELACGVLNPLVDLARDPTVVGRPWGLEMATWYFMSLCLAAAIHRTVLRRQALSLVALAVGVLAVCHSVRVWPPPTLEVWFLPVGQGDSILIRLPSSHHLLVDTGGQAFGPDPGRAVIVPVLRGLGIDTLDVLVLTHEDQDHIGGLMGLVQSYRPRELWLTGPMLAHEELRRTAETLLASGTIVRTMEESRQEFRLGSATIEVLLGASREELESLGTLGINDRSLCLVIRYEGRTILLPGDIQRLGESLLAFRHGSWLQADLVKVPHHGSAGSSTMQFLAQVLPRDAVYTVGLHNRFGFPQPLILERYRTFGVRTWRTDLDGLVRFALSRRGIGVQTGRP